MSAEYMAGRKECVRLAMAHVHTFGFKDEVLHDAVLLVDRTMSSGIGLPPAMLPLLVAACVLIAARQGTPALLTRLHCPWLTMQCVLHGVHTFQQGMLASCN